MTISGMDYTPEMKSTYVGYFLLGLKRVNPFLLWTFETGIHIFDPDLKAGRQAFHLQLESGRHAFNLIWAIPFAGRLYVRRKD